MKIFRRIFISIIILGIIACSDMPMGMGDPIDWEPPVLTLDPLLPTPHYVRNGAIIEGIVTDNVGVDRVIMRDTLTGEVLFTAELLPNNRFKIELDFDFSYNNKKLMVEVVAYDKFGNSGNQSIQAVTLIIDLLPPLVDDIWIQRSLKRQGFLESYGTLSDLEITDPRGERSENADRYQNGMFNIRARLSENETRIIGDVYLEIYDYRHPDTLLLSVLREIPQDPNQSANPFSPSWLINEQEILNAGNSKLDSSYKINYDAGERYYYRVDVCAQDNSGNRNEPIKEHQGFFCMWKTADNPVGILDPVVVSSIPINITRGATIPVIFFDDDVMDIAYADMFSIAQWNGSRPVFGTTTIPQGTDESKLEWILEKLLEGQTVYNWKYDKRSTTLGAEITELLQGKEFNDTIHYIETGNSDTDSGEFIVFSIVRDKKLPPHPDNTQKITINRCWPVNVVDENAPLIIFDTSKGCPRENTFPSPLANRRNFTIYGYTLRDRGASGTDTSRNYVTTLRMAWIPFRIGGGADSRVVEVQNALKNWDGTTYNHSAIIDLQNLGVQFWDLSSQVMNPSNHELESVAGGDRNFIAQGFQKQFDILGSAESTAPYYRHFYSPCNNTADCNLDHDYAGHPGWCRENETKLFIFYAVDTMGHEVNSRLPILGQKNKPNLKVYDITRRTGLGTLNPPKIEDFIYHNPGGTIDATVRAEYQKVLMPYQKTAYDSIFSNVIGSTINITDSDLAQNISYYPKDTNIAYWVTAEEAGDLEIAKITMQDITFRTAVDAGYYDSSTRRLSYTERLPEVTQRTFLFEAEDTLGNVAKIQRVVNITNAAILNEITTVAQDRTYGIGNIITLRAVFSNQVRWTSSNTNTIRPTLTVRFDGKTREIMTKTPANTGRLFLEFDFVVQENDIGTIDSMWSAPAGGNTFPLLLPGDAKIYDNDRGDEAFVPGYLGFIWETSKGSLQELIGGTPKHTISLDGIYPRYSNIQVSGKEPYTGQEYYFNENEIISFTLRSSNKQIETRGTSSNSSGTPRIAFNIGSATNYYATWQRSAESGNAMIFSVPARDLPDGQISNIRIDTINGSITDSVGNVLRNAANTADASASALTLLNSAVVRIDKTRPVAPAATLNNVTITTTYNANPVLRIPDVPSSIAEPYGVDKVQYSLNGGMKWVDFPTIESGWTSSGTNATNLYISAGNWTLQTRYIDKAGNIGVPSSNNIRINAKFPELRSITASSNGRYPTAGDTLQFNLIFENRVYTSDRNNVSITLTNRESSNEHNSVTGAVDPSYQITLTGTQVTDIPQASPSTTVTFTWNPISGKEMRDGLYITAVNFSGLTDEYGNVGSTGVSTSFTQLSIQNINNPSYNCNNLNGAGIIVDCLAPALLSMDPVNAQGRPVDNRATSVMKDNRIIELTFTEPVDAGSGMITIKPHGDFYIPPVFEEKGYYYDTSKDPFDPTSRSAVFIDGYTWIDGFSEIYNNTDSALRANLTAGSNMSNGVTLDTRTGQSAGPYIKMTNGLREGPGYSGDYRNNLTNNAFDSAEFIGPNAGYTSTSTTAATFGNRMIPNTSTKWVLDYRYSISNTENTQFVPATANNPDLADADTNVVPNIRTALINAKYRWQELDVQSSTTISGSTVTIKLEYPLEKGLEWDICYPAGAFIDKSGNPCAAINVTSGNVVGQTGSTHWFLSKGVQTPVIRVNRKSYDDRTANWASTTSTNSTPTNRNVPGGWGIKDFNTVHYRIETETKNARIFYGIVNGRNQTVAGAATGVSVPIGSAYIYNNNNENQQWTGAIPFSGNTNGAENTTAANFDTTTGTKGTWVTPNIIRRATSGGTATYYVIENGITMDRTMERNGNANEYVGFRSYNKDATKTELDNLTLGNEIQASVSSGTNLNFTYYTTEARKDYVSAIARVNHNGTGWEQTGDYQSTRGYEGVFRSVIALNQNRNNNPILAEGSNIKNGMPSISGFPVRDAEETGDRRFTKYFYKDADYNQFYWISTEIVSQWFFIFFGNGGTHMRVGDVNNYLYAGYGDLTYGYRADRY